MPTLSDALARLTAIAMDTGDEPLSQGEARVLHDAVTEWQAMDLDLRVYENREVRSVLAKAIGDVVPEAGTTTLYLAKQCAAMRRAMTINDPRVPKLEERVRELEAEKAALREDATEAAYARTIGEQADKLVAERDEALKGRDAIAAAARVMQEKLADARLVLRRMPLISGKVRNRIERPELLGSKLEDHDEQQAALLAYPDALFTWAVELERTIDGGGPLAEKYAEDAHVKHVLGVLLREMGVRPPAGDLARETIQDRANAALVAWRKWEPSRRSDDRLETNGCTIDVHEIYVDIVNPPRGHVRLGFDAFRDSPLFVDLPVDHARMLAGMLIAHVDFVESPHTQVSINIKPRPT